MAKLHGDLCWHERNCNVQQQNEDLWIRSLNVHNGHINSCTNRTFYFDTCLQADQLNCVRSYICFCFKTMNPHEMWNQNFLEWKIVTFMQFINANFQKFQSCSWGQGKNKHFSVSNLNHLKSLFSKLTSFFDLLNYHRSFICDNKIWFFDRLWHSIPEKEKLFGIKICAKIDSDSMAYTMYWIKLLCNRFLFAKEWENSFVV